MTIEDKAQAYDTAIRKAQDIFHTSEFVKITDLFPELAESEDERITRAINNMLPFIPDEAYANNGVTKEGVLDWLEKQKETSHISEMCKENADSFTEDERIRQWLYNLVDEGAYLCERPFATESILSYLEKQKERGPLTKEEEYTLHRIIEYLDDETCPSEWISLLHGIYCLPYGKQKESAEKEYVFRPLGGTDITVAAEQAIKRVNEGERLVLAFNGAYIPVLKGYDVNEIVDIYNTFVEKKKEPPFVKDVNVGYPGHYFYDGERMYLCSSPALEEKQKEQKTTNELEDAFKYYTDRGITISCGDFKAEPKKEQNGKDEDTDFTIYHPLKNGKGEYECIPYSFYGSLTSFSEDKDLIDFLRTCFYTEEECNEWIEKQKEQSLRDFIDDFPYSDEQKEQKPIECIEFDNEFEKQVSHLLASVLNGEWEYNEGFVKHAAQSLLGYAKHELELDGKALLYTADKSYQIGFRDGVASVKPAEWSESDKGVLMDAICATDKLGNNEVYNKNNPNLAKAFRVAKDWLKNLPERFNLQPKEEWSEDIIRKAVKEVGLTQHQINWFETNVFPPKQEWSEEDEKDVAHIIRILDDCYAYGKHDLSKTDHENLVGTLKSLRPSWKPNEEQMEALDKARRFIPYNCDALESLYVDLKKL